MTQQYEYSPGQFGQGFSYEKPADVASAYEKNAQQYARQLEANMAFERQQADEFDRITSNMAGQDLIAFGKLSKTFDEQLQAVGKVVVENQEANELYSDLFGGGLSEEEDKKEAEVDEAALQVATVNADTALRVEKETGSPALGQLAYDMDNGLAQSFVQSNVNLRQARTLYPAFMAQWMGSNQKITVGGQSMTVAQAVMSGQPAYVSAAMTQGRQNFLRTYGLGSASKRELIKTLGPTILNTDASLSSSAISAGVKAKRTQEVERLSNLGYNIAKEGDLKTQQEDFTKLSQLFYLSPTGMTRAEANKAAVTALANGYAANGNVEAIESMYGLKKVQNADGSYMKGTELSTQYSKELDEARNKAIEVREGKTTQRGKDIEAGMYAQLAGATSPEQRRQIVENAAKQLEENGQHERARQIREQSDNLQVTGSAQYNNALLEDAIRNGEVLTQEPIKQAALMGSITKEQEKNLLALLSSEGVGSTKVPNNQNLKDLLKSSQDRNSDYFIAATGNTKDAYGRVIQSTGGALVTSGEAETITAAMEIEQRRVAVTAWNSTEGTEQQKLIAAQKALQDWRRANVEQPGGKYYVVPKDAKNAWNKDNQKYLKNLSNSPVALIEIRQGAASKPKDFSGFIDPGVRVTPQVRSEFNGQRGDKVFTADEVQILRNQYDTGGGFQQGLVTTADSLGMTPLALLNQQILAHGGTPINPVQLVQQTQRSNPTSLLTGAQTLMAMGFPLRGAAFLSGNIQQESGWNGQRQPWDDVGAPAGGVISWRGGRLESAEAAFGSVENASNLTQLNYMVKELRTNYPEAYRIFSNPRSTRRDLIRASKMFWGYGEEGKRYSYADQAEQQLRNLQSSSSPESAYGKLPPKARTIAVGKGLLSQGYVIWQHPNFDADRGYIKKGTARVGEHSDNSYHYVGQALDFPIGDNGRERLNQLYAYLNANRKRLGITELLWNVEGHYNHLHVSFG